MKHVKLIYSNSFCIILFTGWKPNLSVSDQVPIMTVFKQKTYANSWHGLVSR